MAHERLGDRLACAEAKVGERVAWPGTLVQFGDEGAKVLFDGKSFEIPITNTETRLLIVLSAEESVSVEHRRDDCALCGSRREQGETRYWFTSNTGDWGDASAVRVMHQERAPRGIRVRTGSE